MKKLHLNKTLTLQISAAFAVVAAAATISSQAFAWGPDRPTFTGAEPADYVTFNSITDNTKVGDERNFVRIREAGVGNYRDEIKLVPGKEYQVMTYFHNNAKTSLNESGEGIARDVRVTAQMPSVVKPGERGKISGKVSASNANPTTVWDEAYVTSDRDVAMRYIPGSAKVTSNGAVNGQVLPDALFNTGTLVGYDSLNGVLPGCAEYSGYVIYKFKVDAPDLEVQKQVSPAGKKQWQENYTAAPGAKVDYKISYRNTGTSTQNDVNIRDTLPTGMVYLPGSTKLYNASNPNGMGLGDDIVANGINIGNYTANGNAVVTYSATVAGQDALQCGMNTLTNTAAVLTSGGSKSDTANVQVEGACKPDECKPGVPKGDERCDACVPASGQAVDESGNCVATPAALPTTGPAEVILSIIGVGALTAGGAYWYRSRQNLKKALAGVDLETEAAAHDAPKLLKARTQTHTTHDTHHR